MTDKLQEEIQALMGDKTIENKTHFCCKYQPHDPMWTPEMQFRVSFTGKFPYPWKYMS